MANYTGGMTPPKVGSGDLSSVYGNYDMDYNGMNDANYASGAYSPGQHAQPPYDPSITESTLRGVGNSLGYTGTSMPGLMASTISNLGSSLLSSMFPPKREKTFEEKRYDRMIKFYTGVAKKYKAGRAIVGALTNKKPKDVGIGYDNMRDVLKNVPYNDSGE